MTPSIQIDRNYVTIQGVKVPRPSSISPSQWEAWWNREDTEELETLGAKVAELEGELSTIEDEVGGVLTKRDEALEQVLKLEAKIKAAFEALD